MTDFHAHILPGIDDGSDSIETSLAMLDIWREQGITRVCATPHFYADHDRPDHFFRRRQEAFEMLSRSMQGVGGPDILLGAEVRFYDGIGAADELKRFCLEGTDLLLLEMPFSRWTDRMLSEVAGICRSGVIPVLAHLERYLLLNSKKTIRRIMDMDVLIQCNAEFFLTRSTSRKALRMLEKEQIHFLGSDAHNTSSRPPNLRAALDLIEEKLGTQAIERLNAFMDEEIEAFV